MRRFLLGVLVTSCAFIALAAARAPNIKVTLYCDEEGVGIHAWYPTADEGPLEPGNVVLIPWDQWETGCASWRDQGVAPGS